MAEKNKNQTAAERAALAEALSGKTCTKCGQTVKIKDLVHVKRISYASNGANGSHGSNGTNGSNGTGGRTALAPFHRVCYTF